MSRGRWDRERLLAELARGAEADLAGMADAFELLEEPPAELDGAVLALVQGGLVRGGPHGDEVADEALLALARAVDADLPPPEAVDRQILGRARGDTASVGGGPARAAATAPRSSVRAAGAAAAAALWGFVDRLLREHGFASLTAGLGLAAVVAVELASTAPVPIPAVSRPIEAREVQWARVTEPEVPRAGIEVAGAARTASAAERAIAEALAGPVGIGELGADGALRVRHGAGLGQAAPLQVLEVSGALDRRALALRLEVLGADLGGCPWAAPLAVAIDGQGRARAEALGCVTAALERAPWPVGPARIVLGPRAPR